MKKRNRGRIEATTPAEVPPAPMPINLASVAGMDACAKEAESMRRPSRLERRARLIAAHVALDAVRHEIDVDWPHRDQVLKGIAAAIGQLELRD